jgi:hypothetical protein
MGGEEVGSRGLSESSLDRLAFLALQPAIICAFIAPKTASQAAQTLLDHTSAAFVSGQLWLQRKSTLQHGPLRPSRSPPNHWFRFLSLRLPPFLSNPPTLSSLLASERPIIFRHTRPSVHIYLSSLHPLPRSSQQYTTAYDILDDLLIRINCPIDYLNCSELFNSLATLFSDP